MGYTHYWSINKTIEQKQWRQFAADVSKILNNLPSLGEGRHNALEPIVIQAEMDDPEPPMVEDGMIRFNGVGEDGHETFLLEPNQTSFDFCKTGEKPYDLAVCGVLMLANNHFPGIIDIRSDGINPSSGPDGADPKWHQAKQWVAEATGIPENQLYGPWEGQPPVPLPDNTEKPKALGHDKQGRLNGPSV